MTATSLPREPADAARRRRRLLALLIVAAAAIRFGTLGVQSFELDEVSTVELMRRSLGGMLHALPAHENTPPVYYLLAWGWTRIFGWHEAGLRSFSAVAGTALVPVAYLAGRELLSHRAGAVSAALVAFNPLLVWHSQQARAYELAALLAGLSFLCYLRARRNPSAGVLAAWLLTSALAMATHYFAGFLVAVEAVLLLYSRRRDRGVQIAAGGAAVAGLALAALAVHQRGATGPATIISDSGSLALRVGELPKQYLVGFGSTPVTTGLAVASAVVVLLCLGLLTRAPDGERRAAAHLALLGGAVIAIPLAMAVSGADYFNTRNLLVVLLPVLILVAGGAGNTGSGRLGAAAAVALSVLGAAVVLCVNLDARLQRDDWRGAAQALDVAAVPRLIVVTPPLPGPLELYLPGARPPPPSGVAVGEIDYVGLAAHVAGHTVVAPRAEPPVSFGRLRPLVRERAATFTVLRYALSAPVRVGPGLAPGLGHAEGVAVYQPVAPAR